MSLTNFGTNTLKCEVTDINKNGIWIFVEGKEYFIPFKEFPMFRAVAVEKIFNVTYLPPDHLHWEKLDIDLDLDSIEHPEKYPLIFKE
jgi:hypothetical protein